ncbi:Hsp20/alpha crystallin family protein, partial [bacterium]
MRTLNRIHDFDALAERLWGATTAPSGGPRPLAIDVYETAEAFVVSAAVPGVAPSDVAVQVENNVLTIRVERKATTPEDAKV